MPEVAQYDPGARPDAVLDLLLTQYRESPNLKAVILAILAQIEDVFHAAEIMPETMDLDTAVGEQLTFLGRQLGFPRAHCVCVAPPVYGIDCDDPTSVIEFAGPCDAGSWIDCAIGSGKLSIDDDETYRSLLKARRYQMLGFYDILSLTEALKLIWGDTAWVVDSGIGYVTVAPGRDLTPSEVSQFQIALRALPIAPGVQLRVWYGGGPILGFGDGWAGPCEGSVLCAQAIDPYECAD